MQPLPFDEAIAWARGRSVVLPDIYYGELQGLARALAFSVAGIARLDQLQAILDSLVEATANGERFAEWKKRATDPNGDIRLELPAHRLENIYRTNVQSHYARGRAEQQRAVADAFPYLMYDAVNDSRTRPSHAAMDGRVARQDDPLWQTWRPPVGYQSLLPDQTFAGAVEVGLKAWYSGPAVEIRMKSGARLRVTAQHPVLTNAGWKDAGRVSEGDRLICYADHIAILNGTVSAKDNEQHRPSTAENAFNALSSGGVVSVPTAAFNLNGDVEFIQGDVSVVTANGSLMRALKSGISEMLEHFSLKQPDQRKLSFSCLCAYFSKLLAFFRVFPLGSCFRGGVRRQILKTFYSDSFDFRYGCIWFDPVRFQMTRQPFSVDAKPGSNAFKRFSSLIERDSFVRDRVGVPCATLPSMERAKESMLFIFGSLDPGVRDVFIGGFGVNPNAARDLSHAHPGLIELDDVVDVRSFDYSGHVYDFQCANGVIIAQSGLHLSPIISNCRCRTIALTERQAARFIQADARRMLDSEAATARANARPDPGWDYDILAEPTEGLRRAIAAKSARVDPRLMAAFETAADDALAAWPIRGLARRFPAQDLATLEVLLREYAHRLPGDLPHGVKFVREGGPDDDFYMATDGKGGFWFREVEHQGFNSRRDLFGGLAACATGQTLTCEEEYALESMWHEIWHNRQTGMDQVARLPKIHPTRLFAETLNQVVARLTYPRLIERLGGKAQHQTWVMENGYGYASLVQRFRRVIDALGLDLAALTGDLATINAQSDLLRAAEIVSRRLAKKGGATPARVQAALDGLTAEEARFSDLLGEIKSPF